MLWIYFSEKAEIKYHWVLILLKHFGKCTTVNLLTRKKSCGFISMKCWNKVALGIYFVETRDKRYVCEFIYNKEVLWIDLFENPEIKYHWGFILLKLLSKGTAMNLFKTKKCCEFISLKFWNKVPVFCWISW